MGNHGGTTPPILRTRQNCCPRKLAELESNCRNPQVHSVCLGKNCCAPDAAYLSLPRLATRPEQNVCRMNQGKSRMPNSNRIDSPKRTGPHRGLRTRTLAVFNALAAAVVVGSLAHLFWSGAESDQPDEPQQTASDAQVASETPTDAEGYRMLAQSCT